MLRKEIKHIQSSRKDLRSFGLVVGGVLAVIGAVFFWFNKPAYPYPLGIGVALILSGLLIPNLLKPLQKVWMTIAIILGWFMTRVILTVLYYTVFTFIGKTGKLFGKQFIEINWDKSQNTYWNYRELNEVIDKTVYEKQF